MTRLRFAEGMKTKNGQRYFASVRVLAFIAATMLSVYSRAFWIESGVVSSTKLLNMFRATCDSLPLRTSMPKLYSIPHSSTYSFSDPQEYPVIDVVCPSSLTAFIVMHENFP